MLVASLTRRLLQQRDQRVTRPAAVLRTYESSHYVPYEGEVGPRFEAYSLPSLPHPSLPLWQVGPRSEAYSLEAYVPYEGDQYVPAAPAAGGFGTAPSSTAEQAGTTTTSRSRSDEAGDPHSDPHAPLRSRAPRKLPAGGRRLRTSDTEGLINAAVENAADFLRGEVRGAQSRAEAPPE